MLIKKISFGCISFMAILALTACHQRVEPVSGMEKQMSCAELRQEINEAQIAKKKIASSRGICGRNAIGLLFWPSIVINEVTGESAENDATDRLVQLRNIYAAKKCSNGDCAEDAKKG